MTKKEEKIITKKIEIVKKIEQIAADVSGVDTAAIDWLAIAKIILQILLAVLGVLTPVQAVSFFTAGGFSKLLDKYRNANPDK
jgi:hypothetical protein